MSSFMLQLVDQLRSRYRRVVKPAILDLALIGAAYTIAFFARAFTAPLDYLVSVPMILFFSGILIGFLYVFGVYRRIWDRTSGHEVQVLVNAVMTASLVILIYSSVVDTRPLPLSVTLMANLLSLVFLVAVRYRSRLIHGLDWRWRAIWKSEFPKVDKRVLIIGAGESGQALVMRLKHRIADARYQIVGFIDDDPEKYGMYVEGCRILGTRHDVVHIVDSEKVDLIVVAIHRISGTDMREILQICERTKAMIKVVPDFFALMQARTSATLLRDVQPEDLIGRNIVTRHAGVDLSPIIDKVILVTGAAGSIGSELSRQIVDYKPQKVVLIDNNESGLHDLQVELQARYPHTPIIPALVDITVEDAVDHVFREHLPQIVFHAAAYKHVPMLERYPREALRVNIQGTRNVVSCACEQGVERFVLISSDKAVNPSSVMGATKRVCELMLHSMARQGYKTQFASVRFGNVLGSRGSVVPTFNRQIDSGGPVTVTDSEMTRYFMSIPEAVNLIIHAAAMTTGNDIFILRMGEKVRIIDLAERMIRLRGLRPYQDINIEFTGVRPGEKLHEELYYGEELPVDTRHPGILQLRKQTLYVDPQALWGGLESLSREVEQAPHNALGALLRVIGDIQQHSIATAIMPQPVPVRQNGLQDSASPRNVH